MGLKEWYTNKKVKQARLSCLKYLLTSLFQSGHGCLLNQVPLNEASKVFTVNTKVRELECVDGHLQREMFIVAFTGHMGPCKGDYG